MHSMEWFMKALTSRCDNIQLLQRHMSSFMRYRVFSVLYRSKSCGIWHWDL